MIRSKGIRSYSGQRKRDCRDLKGRKRQNRENQKE